MVEVMTTDYRSESTENLIRRAEQMLAYPGIYPKTDDIIPYSRSGFGFMMQQQSPSIRSLAPSCNRIEVRNVITVTDSSIVTCADAVPANCGAIPVTCPSVTPNDWVNMVAIVNALVAQNGVTIRFEYLLNDVPTVSDVLANLAAGNNDVYAFAANLQYTADTTLTLYGARVL